ncbi:hypothetical protein G6F61_014907 [Rhizopus arrhizus]|nr:hypothetical protein G6F61_014907 [Rhizopus arrhizus]
MRSGSPRNRTLPRRARRRPHRVSASSLRPAPIRPEMPRISPRLSVNEMPCTLTSSAMPSTSSKGAALPPAASLGG